MLVFGGADGPETDRRQFQAAGQFLVDRRGKGPAGGFIGPVTVEVFDQPCHGVGVEVAGDFQGPDIQAVQQGRERRRAVFVVEGLVTEDDMMGGDPEDERFASGACGSEFGGGLLDGLDDQGVVRLVEPARFECTEQLLQRLGQACICGAGHVEVAVFSRI
jgi:hypothetical protein